MKIKSEHFEILKEAIEQVIADNPEAYTEYKKEGLSDTRYNWDLLHASQVRIGQQSTMPDTCNRYWLPLYDYMNDNHISTALKNITGKRG